MIIKIDNKKIEISKEIYSIFQASYKIEAELLQATNFPPLNRTISEFSNSNNSFYANYLDNDIAGVIEVDDNGESTHIQSLVVYPKYFRQGIAKQLVQFVLDSYVSKQFTVETGLDNKPAIKLYTRFNFQETKQWNTNHGVRKIRFEKRISKKEILKFEGFKTID